MYMAKPKQVQIKLSENTGKTFSVIMPPFAIAIQVSLPLSLFHREFDSIDSKTGGGGAGGAGGGGGGGEEREAVEEEERREEAIDDNEDEEDLRSDDMNDAALGGGAGGGSREHQESPPVPRLILSLQPFPMKHPHILTSSFSSSHPDIIKMFQDQQQPVHAAGRTSQWGETVA